MNLLVIEDDKRISDVIHDCLCEIYKVTQVYDGEEGAYMAMEGVYDLIILDLMLPNQDGFSILKELRQKKNFTPVLILTAKDDIQDKIKGFHEGADDYLIKPFQKEELIVRIDAILRRYNKGYTEQKLKLKDLELDIKNRAVYIGENKLNLQGKQFDMLEYLLHERGSIVTRNQIFTKIWGYDSDTTLSVIEVYASGIRKEMKKYKYDKYLKTIRGTGYMIGNIE